MDTCKEPFGSRREDVSKKAEEGPPARLWRKNGIAQQVSYVEDEVRWPGSQ